MVKLIVDQFDKFQIFDCFYDNDALCFAYQKEQTYEGPTFLFFKDGLREEILSDDDTQMNYDLWGYK